MESNTELFKNLSIVKQTSFLDYFLLTFAFASVCGSYYDSSISWGTYIWLTIVCMSIYNIRHGQIVIKLKVDLESVDLNVYKIENGEMIEYIIAATEDEALLLAKFDNIDGQLHFLGKCKSFIGKS